jgi:hypothetical protein
MQQSTISEITRHHDDNGDDEFNYSHGSCPTCQDWLIVESAEEGCEDHIFCEYFDFGCPKCQCQWDEVEELVEKFFEGESILTRLKDEDNMASRARNLLYKILIRVFSGPLGKGDQMQIPDCCLKGVRSLLKNKDPNEVYNGFKPVSKRSKSRYYFHSFQFIYHFNAPKCVVSKYFRRRNEVACILRLCLNVIFLTLIYSLIV